MTAFPVLAFNACHELELVMQHHRTALRWKIIVNGQGTNPCQTTACSARESTRCHGLAELVCFATPSSASKRCSMGDSVRNENQNALHKMQLADWWLVGKRHMAERPVEHPQNKTKQNKTKQPSGTRSSKRVFGIQQPKNRRSDRGENTAARQGQNGHRNVKEVR